MMNLSPFVVFYNHDVVMMRYFIWHKNTHPDTFAYYLPLPIARAINYQHNVYMKKTTAFVCSLLLLLMFSKGAFSQKLQITGKVTNKSSGMPIEGVSVTLKGARGGTATDAQGNYSIAVNGSAVLRFTFVGYATKEVAIAGAGAYNVELEAENTNLNEVVVVGYGTRSRKALSSSISSISAKEITATPVADAGQALQGRVSGVTIVQGSGAPGGTGGTQIRIRGLSSITGTNNPLIVVDGFPLPDQGADNILNSFGTGDIESIDVLKDAAAASIYGVRASNGVIMITTKRGKAGKANITADVYRGLQSAWRLPSLLNAREYAVLNSEARVASGLPILPKLADYNNIEAQYGQGTDWMKEIFRRAAMTNATMTATGGSDAAKYMFSAGYFKQDGIIYNTDYERYTLRFNGDIKVNNHIKLGNSLSMNRMLEHGTNTYDPFNSVILLAMMAPPTVKPRNSDGSYSGGNGAIDGFNEPNPVYNLEVPQNSYTKYRVNGNVFAEISFLKYLRLKTLVGADYTIGENRSFSPATPASGGRPIINDGYYTQKLLNPNYLTENTLTFENTFAGKHKVNAVIGYTWQEDRYSFVNASRGNGLFNAPVPALNNQIFTPTDISQLSNAAEDGINWRLISYIGRVNYDFDNKAFLSFSIRRDGSSNFAPANKYAVFPSVSAAYRLTQEKFMQNIKWLNELKIRASYGFTGNPNVAPYAYLQKVNQSFQYTFGNSAGSGGIVTGAAPSASYNPNIKWEKNQQVDLGLDATMLDNRLNISLDLYNRQSKDLILYVAPAFVSGTYESVPFNTGTLQNKGIDLTIGGTPYTSKDFRWNVNGVLSAYKNKVTSLGISALIDNGGFTRITGGSLRTNVGLPINYFYGYVTDGIFQSYDEIRKSAVQTAGTDPTTSTAPGDIRFKDLNGDGVINGDDRTNIGNQNPTFTYGLTNTFNYKGLELSVFLQGSQGNRVLNFTRWYTEGGTSNGNYSKDVINRWTPSNTGTSMPRLALNDPNGNNRVSDRFVETASYMRIKNVRLSYTLPVKWVSPATMKRVQVYVSAQNLVTVTNYTGMDPEVGGGVDLGFYPQARTFLGGVTIEF
jgi:TonB-linked SusC/RagA family outer membrane protein